MTIAGSNRTAPTPSHHHAAGCAPSDTTVLRKGRLALAGMMLLTLWAGMHNPVAAQEKEKPKVSLYVTYDSQGSKPKQDIELRPNVSQEVFVFLENDGDKDETVAVQVVASGSVLLTKQVQAIKGKPTRVPFTAPPLKEGEKAPGMKNIGKNVLLRLVDGAGKGIGNDFPMIIGDPYTFLKPAAEYYPDTNKDNPRTFKVFVDPSDIYYGPRSKVEIDLRSDRLPGLVANQKPVGRYTGYLGARTTSALPDGIALEAKSLQLSGGDDIKGFAYLTVDGYRRAFVFYFTPAFGGTTSTPRLIEVPVLRVGVPTYIRPTEKLSVAIEADGKIAPEDRIKLGLYSGTDKKGKDIYSDIATFVGPRQVGLKFAQGGNGGLVFQPEIADWTTTVDMSGVTGRTRFRLRLFDEAGKLKSMRDGVTGAERVDEIIQTVILDNSAPDSVQIVSNTPVVKGRSFRIKARAFDEESGIKEVVFFLGKPVDGKIPEGALRRLGEFLPIDAETEVVDQSWQATIPVPTNQKSPLVVSVMATNGVGLSKFDTVTLTVRDAPPTSAIVAGRVFEQDVPVDNQTIYLLNTKGQWVDKMRTANGGRFEFKDVEDGKYRLFARRDSTKSKGQLDIAVESHKDLTDLELILNLPAKGKDKDKKKASIAGTVTEGSREQPNLTVRLFDAANKQLKTTTTDRQGRYEFKDLNKGTYKILVIKSASRTRGLQTVELGETEEKKGVAIKLIRP